MEFIRTLMDINQQELPMVGGKGANLGALIHAHFPVPPGFVVLTNAYQLFLNTNGLLEEVERLVQQATPCRVLCSGQEQSNKHSRKPTHPLHRI